MLYILTVFTVNENIILWWSNFLSLLVHLVLYLTNLHLIIQNFLSAFIHLVTFLTLFLYIVKFFRHKNQGLVYVVLKTRMNKHYFDFISLNLVQKWQWTISFTRLHWVVWCFLGVWLTPCLTFSWGKNHLLICVILLTINLLWA